MRFLHAALLALFGVALLWPAVGLLLMGGSPWYVAAAGVSLVCAWLILRRSRWAPRLYALFLLLSLAWALWESGPQPWALLPRLGVPVLLGVPFLFGLALPRRRPRVAAALVALAACALAAGVATRFAAPTAAAVPGERPVASGAAGDWLAYGNDPGGSRFSPLAQITPANIGELAEAWTYRTGHMARGLPLAFQATPLAADGRLFLCSGDNDVIAVDGESGREIWRYRAHVDLRGVAMTACRGVAFHRRAGATGPCATRILAPTMDARLIALDAATGRPCEDFGRNGTIDLREGLGPFEKGYYFATSAPTVIGDRVVLGGLVIDGQHVGEPSGVIRAFDVGSGALAWAFDAGRPDRKGAPPPGERYTPGTPNSWAPMSADPALGLVYVPTGSATPDYYGGQRRPFDERYSASVVALDAATGGVRWLFQTTHHDLWDYDVPAQPTLIDLDGVPALVQPTKRGEIFLLDRRTGKPLSRVEERRVPASHVPGERASPTQPFSTGLPNFAGPALREVDMWGLTPIDQAWCRARFRKLRYEGPLTPPGLDRPSLVYPGYGGGINWGGVAVVARRGIMLVNSNRVGNTVQLLSRAEADRRGIKPLSTSGHGSAAGAVAQAGLPYAAEVSPLFSPLGVPCQQPPWGMISAVDLRSHKLLWSHPFGTGRDSGPFGIPSGLPFEIGVPNTGGAVLTRSGLAFIGATQDRYLRAYELASGRELWRRRLPAGGQATPMTFWSQRSGRQFVVIAAGGHPGLAPGHASDHLVAYALPRNDGRR